MLKTVFRAFHDEFSWSLFNELLDTVKCEYEAHYIWSNGPIFNKFFKTYSATTPVVIIGIKDGLDNDHNFIYSIDEMLRGSSYIVECADRNPNTQFIILTSLENLNLEIKRANIRIIPWGGDITNQIEGYETLEPVVNKNFASSKHYISLNRSLRMHRLIYLSYLYYHNLDSLGHISHLDPTNFQIVPGVTNKTIDILDIINWEFDLAEWDTQVQIKQGWNIFLEKFEANRDANNFDIYEKIVNEKIAWGYTNNDNLVNFEQRLTKLYENSFVEIVSESSFTQPSFNITEKTMNSIYGYNFPIFLSSSGTVRFLRDIGIDVFDDIIDHSYDLELEPIKRITLAVDNNKRLLMDPDYVKHTWSKCTDRFASNVNVARGLSNWYRNRTVREFTQSIQQFQETSSAS